MDNVKLSFELIAIKKAAENSINELVKEGCICENGIKYGSSSCTNQTRNWRCFHCGASRTIVDCGMNHMYYDCPYCGGHLT